MAQVSWSGALPNRALKLLNTCLRGDKMYITVFVTLMCSHFTLVLPADFRLVLTDSPLPTLT